MALAALSWLESVPEAFFVFHFCNISLKDLYLNDKMFSIFEKKKTMNLKCLDEIEKLSVLIFQIQSNFSSFKILL